jgi:hypothetical protein
VKNGDRFPSSTSTVGLGRNFAWNQWARVNGVVDTDFRVDRDQAARFLNMADQLRTYGDIAHDARTSPTGTAPAAPGSAPERGRVREKALVCPPPLIDAATHTVSGGAPAECVGASGLNNSPFSGAPPAHPSPVVQLLLPLN